MSERYPFAQKGADNLRLNRECLARAEGINAPETDHNPPSKSSEGDKIHYTATYDWDEAAANYMSATTALQNVPNAEYYADAARRGLRVLTEGIDEEGFLPNYRYIGKPRKFDPEMLLAFGRGATQSNYTQPPLLALATLQTYHALKEHGEGAERFLDDTYPSLVRHYDYLDRELSNSETDKLQGIYHPHMTGRDSDPTFDHIKPLRIPRIGIRTPKQIDKANIAIDYGSILWHGIKLRRAGSDTKAWREVYWMNDVMMNCITQDNLNDMTTLAIEQGKAKDAEKFSERAKILGEQIIKKMWFSEARNGNGAFLGLDKNGRPINEVSISNLFPLTLHNLPEGHLESILKMMDTSFNTPYPLPSVATDSPNYDPYNVESWRLWRGSKWMITDWYITERGLWRQIERDDLSHRPDLIERCTDWAYRIADKSFEVVERHTPREHYNPITGEGQRKAVVNFGWSNLAYFMRREND